MAVEVEVNGRDLEITDRLYDYVTGKVSKLDRYLNDINEAQVDLAYIKSARNAADRQVAQITVRGKRFILRSEERADDIFAAVDIALDKMQRQISRYKGKRQRGRGDGTSVAEALDDSIEVKPSEFADPEYPEIVRRKRFTLVPMDEAEAIEQMALLGHENFFVFYNANTNAISVLYRRRDGTYGLIEPEIG